MAVYAVRAATPGGPETVVAAMSLDPAAAQARKVAEFTAALAAGALAVVAAVCWLTAGLGAAAGRAVAPAGRDDRGQR